MAGGFTLDEPGVDLGVAVAVASSFTERRVSPGTVLLGEIGLGGELRPVPRTDMRVREAAKLGFERCVLPKGGAVASGERDGRRGRKGKSSCCALQRCARLSNSRSIHDFPTICETGENETWRPRQEQSGDSIIGVR